MHQAVINLFSKDVVNPLDVSSGDTFECSPDAWIVKAALQTNCAFLEGIIAHMFQDYSLAFIFFNKNDLSSSVNTVGTCVHHACSFYNGLASLALARSCQSLEQKKKHLSKANEDLLNVEAHNKLLSVRVI